VREAALPVLAGFLRLFGAPERTRVLAWAEAAVGRGLTPLAASGLRVNP